MRTAVLFVSAASAASFVPSSGSLLGSAGAANGGQYGLGPPQLGGVARQDHVWRSTPFVCRVALHISLKISTTAGASETRCERKPCLTVDKGSVCEKKQDCTKMWPSISGIVASHGLGDANVPPTTTA